MSEVVPGLPLALVASFADGTIGTMAQEALDVYGMDSLLSSAALFAVDVTRNCRQYLTADDPEHLSTWFAQKAAEVHPTLDNGRIYIAQYIEFSAGVCAHTHELDHTEPGSEVQLTGEYHIGNDSDFAQYLTAATEYIYRLMEQEAGHLNIPLGAVIDNYRAALAHAQ